jgi:hypothetical protein
MSDDDFDAFIERMLATCACEICSRYRRLYALRVAKYTEALERAIGLRETIAAGHYRATPV